MKQIAVVLLLAVALLGPVHAAADNEFNGAPDLAGFRGMKWGANVTDFQGLVKLNDDPFVQRYSKKNDRLQIDGVGLESVSFIIFTRAGYMGVSISAGELTSGKNFKASFLINSGPPRIFLPQVGGPQYEWRAARSTPTCSL